MSSEQQARLAEARLKIMLDRHLAAQGWPERARDYAAEEVMNTSAAKSHVLGGAPAPDAYELAAAVFATTRGGQLKVLIDEAARIDATPKVNSHQALIDDISKIANPAARITAARKAGLA